MNLTCYPYSSNHCYKNYSFYSKGPNGIIKKTVVYTKFFDHPVMYKLAFGDENPYTGEVSDLIKSNNNDRDIVLATVAKTINDFSNYYGNQLIFATGSTEIRTRLYQIGISALWNEIQKDFDLWGSRDGNWHKFQRNVNYQAFLAKRNQHLHL